MVASVDRTIDTVNHVNNIDADTKQMTSDDMNDNNISRSMILKATTEKDKDTTQKKNQICTQDYCAECYVLISTVMRH